MASYDAISTLISRNKFHEARDGALSLLRENKRAGLIWLRKKWGLSSIDSSGMTIFRRQGTSPFP